MAKNNNLQIYDTHFYIKKITTFATFAISDNKNSIIASIQYRDNYHFHINNTNLERLSYFNNLIEDFSISLRSYRIIHVVQQNANYIDTKTESFFLNNENEKNINFYSTNTSSNSKSNSNSNSNFNHNPNDNSLFFENYHQNSVFYGKIYKHNFFTDRFIKKFIFERKKELIEYIFIFEDMQWKTLVDSFKSLNIKLSGGSTVSRHILTPVQVNLSKFILGLEGLNESHLKSKNSFKLHKKLHTYLRLENFVKDRKIILIRKYLKHLTNPERNKYLIIQLYCIYKNSPQLINFIFTSISWGLEQLYKNQHPHQHEIVYNNIEKILLDYSSNFVDLSKEGDILKNIQNLESKLYFNFTNKKENNFEDILKEISDYNHSLIKNKEIFKMFIDTKDKNLEFKDKNIKLKEKFKKKGEEEVEEFKSKLNNIKTK